MGVESKEKEQDNIPTNAVVLYTGVPIYLGAINGIHPNKRCISVCSIPFELQSIEVLTLRRLEDSLQKFTAVNVVITSEQVLTCSDVITDHGWQPHALASAIKTTPVPELIHQQFYQAILNQIRLLGLLLTQPIFREYSVTILQGLRAYCQSNQEQQEWAWQMMRYHYVNYKSSLKSRSYHLKNLISYGIYAARLGHSKAYQALVSNAHNIKPDESAYWFAQVCYQRGNMALAKRFFTRFVDEDHNEKTHPHYVYDSYLKLAKLHYACKEFQEAKFALGIACALYPNDHAVLAIISDHISEFSDTVKIEIATILRIHSNFITGELNSVLQALESATNVQLTL